MGKAEGYIENYLVEQAEKIGFLCPKFVSPGNSGVPDRILIGNGYTVFVETKSEVGKLRPLQEYRIKELRKRGATVYVVNTRKQVLELLKMLSQQKD